MWQFTLLSSYLPSSLRYVTPITSSVHSKISSIDVHWLNIRTRWPDFFIEGRSSANVWYIKGQLDRSQGLVIGTLSYTYSFLQRSLMKWRRISHTRHFAESMTCLSERVPLVSLTPNWNKSYGKKQVSLLNCITCLCMDFKLCFCKERNLPGGYGNRCNP